MLAQWHRDKRARDERLANPEARAAYAAYADQLTPGSLEWLEAREQMASDRVTENMIVQAAQRLAERKASRHLRSVPPRSDNE